MKNITKRIIAVFAVLCVAAASVTGCAKKNENSNNEAVMKFPLQFGEAGDGNPLTPDEPDVDLNAADPTQPAVIDDEPAVEEVTEYEDVTDAAGEPVTEVVEATEADGQTATDAQGAVVTDIAKVTTVIVKPAPTNPPTEPPTKGYTAKMDRRYAMWLDISKDENFRFEDDFLKAKFKIRSDVPDGDYKVRIVTDLSDIAGKVVYADKVIDGTVRINNGKIDAADMSGETGLTFYGDNIACKQGDTIEYCINVKNNPGLAAFCIWIYFDSNAMEFIEAGASGTFEDIARSTDIGEGKYDGSLKD